MTLCALSLLLLMTKWKCAGDRPERFLLPSL